MGFFSSYLKKDEVEAGSPFFKKKTFFLPLYILWKIIQDLSEDQTLFEEEINFPFFQIFKEI